MPKLADALKAEIARICRKEIKSSLAGLQKSTKELRASVRSLRDEISQQKKSSKAIVKQLDIEEPAKPEDSMEDYRLTGKGVVAIRKRTGLSQREFARLIGVSMNSVSLWEGKPGVLKLRGSNKADILSLKGVGKREAQKLLEEMEAK
ncbi:MAG: hypothetical protein GF398_08850 [Chitinivibrionales bacterium]|nr:hypothetical protein [Chitinivibrionales bacterium]